MDQKRTSTDELWKRRNCKVVAGMAWSLEQELGLCAGTGKAQAWPDKARGTSVRGASRAKHRLPPFASMSIVYQTFHLGHPGPVNVGSAQCCIYLLAGLSRRLCSAAIFPLPINMCCRVNGHSSAAAWAASMRRPP